MSAPRPPVTATELVVGDLDITTARDLLVRTSTWTLPPGSTVVLDLDGVQHVDEAGVVALLRSRRSLGRRAIATRFRCDRDSPAGQRLRLHGLTVDQP